MRRARALVFAFGFLAVLAWACGDDETPATTPPDATIDAGDDRGESPIGDGGGDADATTDPGCRTAAAPSAKCAASPSACERKTLYLSPSSTFPFAIVTDESNVYWVAQSGAADAAYDGTATASILRISKTGAPTQTATVLAQNQSRATTLVRDGADLYWVASEANDAGSTSTLRRLVSAKGTPEDVVTFPGITRRLVRAAPGVFFSTDGAGSVRRIAREGAGTTFTATQVDQTSSTPSLAASKDAVFAGGGQSTRVARLAPGGGAGTTFLSVPDGGVDASVPGVHVLGADCDRLFGIRDDQASFFWSPATAPTYTATAATFDDAADIVSDEGFVYVARKKGGGVERGRRDGSGFASAYAGDVWRLAVDDDGIYWGEHAKGSLAGNVFMQTKK